MKLQTSDGLELEGWYVPSRNGAAVIVFPGRSGTRKQAAMLARNGYGVLLYDRRGEGASEGDPNGWGWDFDKDIRAGISFLKQRDDVEAGRIGGLGLSVGGEMLLQTAAETTDLAAVVSEGAGARTLAEEVSDVAGINRLTTFVSYLARDAANAVFSNRLPPQHLEENAGRARHPRFGETWLDPTMDGSGMRELLGPLASERLTVRPANPLVNGAHNDGHHCLELQAAA